MAHILKNASAALGIFALLASSAGAQAGTRAGDGGTYYTATSTAQVAGFPESVWFLPDERDSAKVWKWLATGAAGFLLLAAVISKSPDRRPPNRSNGAN